MRIKSKSQSPEKVVSLSIFSGRSLLDRSVSTRKQAKQQQKMLFFASVTGIPLTFDKFLPNVPAESSGGLPPSACLAGTGKMIAVQRCT